LLKFCFVNASSAASSKGIFAVATNSFFGRRFVECRIKTFDRRCVQIYWTKQLSGRYKIRRSDCLR